ncbi:MAG: hypothetical protein NPIRA02_38310 [Nitrospirales bacterium]|nr:MAG: hypothetical protein NPIRA02_38310 [Nitrospirales bacterium]
MPTFCTRFIRRHHQFFTHVTTRSLFVLCVVVSGLLWNHDDTRVVAAEKELTNTVMPFDIPAQALSSALQAFGKQSGLPVLYSSEFSRDRKTRPLTGTYPADQALEQLLKGTGLTYETTPSGTVTIKQGLLPPKPMNMAADDSPADTRTQRSTADDAPVETLPEVLVPGFRLSRSSYSAPNATTATKTDTPIMQTPLSIQVVPKSVLADQQATTILESLDLVSNNQTKRRDSRSGSCACGARCV